MGDVSYPIFLYPNESFLDCEVIPVEITRETVIGEIVENCPEAMPVFQEIGMHCMGCAMASGETLEQACAAHGVDPDELLDYLKKFLESC